MARRRKGWAGLAFAAFVSVVIAAVILGRDMISRVFSPPVNLQNACVQALPQNQRVGIKVEQKNDGSITMYVAGQQGVQAGATPQQMEQFVKCLELVTGAKVTVENGVRLTLEPVGQVANVWQREKGVKLLLMPGDNDEALNNLRIGPAAGLKEDVIRSWCSKEQTGACVSCDPNHPTADSEVVIHLRQNAPLEKLRLSGTWPVAPQGTKLEPWQLVNSKGERFYYECKK